MTWAKAGFYILLSGLGSAAMAQDVVKLGIAAPMTGPIAHLGKDVDQGARLAIDEINQRGLAINGKLVRLEAVVEDDRGDPAAATAVANTLADRKVNGVIGHLNSGPTIAAARVYNDAGIPQVAPAATNPKYTQAGYKYAVRLMATDVQQGAGIAGFLASKLSAKKVAVIDDRTAYGQGLADEVASTLAKGKVQVLPREFTTDKATDFTAILTTIKAANPDAIVYAGADAQAGPLSRQIKQLGITSKLIAGDGVCTGSWSELAAGANEGFYCSQAGMPSTRMKTYADFNKRFKARYGSEPIVFAPYAYDAVLVLVEAMKAARSTDPTVYAPYVSRVQLDGITGPVRFDSRGDNQNGEVTIYQVQSGKLVAVP